MKKKNIIIAFAMLLLTGVALSTATYAWFTANTLIQLGRIDVQVSATNGIQVSTDATDWKTTLTTDHIRNAYYTGSVTQFPDATNITGNVGDYLQPVSTDGTMDSGKFKMYYGQLQEDGSINLTAATETNGSCSDNTFTTPSACVAGSATWTEAANAYFIAFDIFIQSSNPDAVEVGLLPTSTVSINEGGQDAGLKSSIRVGFINSGNASSATAAWALATNTAYSIWEPNADTHTATAINRGYVTAGQTKAYKGATAVGTNVDLTSTTNFLATPSQTSGVGNLIQTETSNGHFNKGTTVADGTLTGATAWNSSTLTGYPTVVTVSQGITKVRVYIWIEGQDVDCENTATLGTAVGVTINLNAKVATP